MYDVLRCGYCVWLSTCHVAMWSTPLRCLQFRIPMHVTYHKCLSNYNQMHSSEQPNTMKRGFQTACMAVWICGVIRYDYQVRWSHRSQNCKLQVDVLMYIPNISFIERKRFVFLSLSLSKDTIAFKLCGVRLSAFQARSCSCVANQLVAPQMEAYSPERLEILAKCIHLDKYITRCVVPNS